MGSLRRSALWWPSQLGSGGNPSIACARICAQIRAECMEAISPMGRGLISSLVWCCRWSMPTATTAWTPVSAFPTVFSSRVTLTPT